MSDEDLLVLLIGRNFLADAPTTIKHYSPHKSVMVGIGKDHVATILIDEEAYNELIKRHCGDEYL